MNMIRYYGNRFVPETALKMVVRRSDGTAVLHFDDMEKVLVDLSDVKVIPIEEVLNPNNNVIVKTKTEHYTVYVCDIKWDIPNGSKENPPHSLFCDVLLSDEDTECDIWRKASAVLEETYGMRVLEGKLRNRHKEQE